MTSQAQERSASLSTNAYEVRQMNKQTLTQEYVKKLFNYDPVTGYLTRKITRSNRNKIGDRVGSKHKADRKIYLRVNIDRKLYYVHRVIWLFVTGDWPENEIDHQDGNGLNNWWDNLRDVTRVVNSQNHRLADNNTSGVVGVYFFKRTRGWYSNIQVEGESIYLGYYRDFFETVCARKSAENKYGFHENHGSIRPL